MIEKIPVKIKYSDGHELSYPSLGEACRALGITRQAGTHLLTASRVGYQIIEEDDPLISAMNSGKMDYKGNIL